MLRAVLDLIPPKIKNRLKNRLTLAIHRWFVMRPAHVSALPSGMTIELTDICNLACSYCPKSVGIGVKGNHMDFNLFKRVVDEACALLPIRQVPLVGFGEPFLYPHLEEAVAYIKAKDPAIVVTLTSNGTLLNSDWGKRLAELGLNQITISVNATNREQYIHINRDDCYEEVVANTRAFLEAVNRTSARMRVLIQVLELPDGSTDVGKFRRQWEPYLGRCGEIQVQPFVNWAGAIREEDVIRRPDPVESSLLNPSLHKKREMPKPAEQYPCARLLNSLIISREGNALACCMVFPKDQGDLELGNIQDKTLSELYFGPRAKSLRELNTNGRISEVKPCDKCDAYLTMPNLWFKNPLHRWFGPKWW